jgi:hypothetical protein
LIRDQTNLSSWIRAARVEHDRGSIVPDASRLVFEVVENKKLVSAPARTPHQVMPASSHKNMQCLEYQYTGSRQFFVTKEIVSVKCTVDSSSAAGGSYNYQT